MSLGFWGGDHVNFLQLRGPGGKGFAEIAVSPYGGKMTTSSDPRDDTPPPLVTTQVDGQEETSLESSPSPTLSAEEGQTKRRGYLKPLTSALAWWRSRRGCTPLGAYLTYVQLPWESIIQDILQGRRDPVLYTDV
jgi:hypothetical protein